MYSNWFMIDSTPPKLTDWIQAGGTIIAIIAAIIGFVKLFIKDRQHEKEISSLTQIAAAQESNLKKVQSLLKESQKQTMEFIIQTGEMQKSNSLYKRHLEVLGETMADNKAHQSKMIQIKKAERKNEILPRFKMGGFSHMNINVNMQLQLVKNVAYFETYNNDPRSGITLSPQMPKGKSIGTNETIAFNGMISGEFSILRDYQPTPRLIGEILFRNEDKDLYRQVITRSGAGFEIGQPEEAFI
ncbi:hypothetical protein HDF19_13145 [Mucilaginibacter sp. E4BP6]|uniref:hypothetical protein n=1 Tax=Mucilaginibacter sp. E4BP6 TaxID=2723089 RepID=UPI0015CB59BF|nr:hypothetical protein [Mucilaginibacter sp. E4BP6]NYE64880.1 autonomous glycyl radical cofactor GrcA [Mucilaginibacter sp. E4BP6]